MGDGDTTEMIQFTTSLSPHQVELLEAYIGPDLSDSQLLRLAVQKAIWSFQEGSIDSDDIQAIEDDTTAIAEAVDQIARTMESGEVVVELEDGDMVACKADGND